MSLKPGNIRHVNSGNQTFFKLWFFFGFSQFLVAGPGNFANALPYYTWNADHRHLHRQHLCVVSVFYEALQFSARRAEGECKSLINFEIKKY